MYILKEVKVSSSMKYYYFNACFTMMLIVIAAFHWLIVEYITIESYSSIASSVQQLHPFPSGVLVATPNPKMLLPLNPAGSLRIWEKGWIALTPVRKIPHWKPHNPYRNETLSKCSGRSWCVFFIDPSRIHTSIPIQIKVRLPLESSWSPLSF